MMYILDFLMIVGLVCCVNLISEWLEKLVFKLAKVLVSGKKIPPIPKPSGAQMEILRDKAHELVDLAFDEERVITVMMYEDFRKECSGVVGVFGERDFIETTVLRGAKFIKRGDVQTDVTKR